MEKFLLLPAQHITSFDDFWRISATCLQHAGWQQSVLVSPVTSNAYVLYGVTARQHAIWLLLYLFAAPHAYPAATLYGA